MYYYNSVTTESSWSKPAGFSGEVQDAKPTSQLRVPGTQWYEIHCEDGRKYYYNDESEVKPGNGLLRMCCTTERPILFKPLAGQATCIDLQCKNDRP